MPWPHMSLMDHHALIPLMHTSKDKKPVIITTKSPLSLAISHFLKHSKQAEKKNLKEFQAQRGYLPLCS